MAAYLDKCPACLVGQLVGREVTYVYVTGFDSSASERVGASVGPTAGAHQGAVMADHLMSVLPDKAVEKD